MSFGRELGFEPGLFGLALGEQPLERRAQHPAQHILLEIGEFHLDQFKLLRGQGVISLLFAREARRLGAERFDKGAGMVFGEQPVLEDRKRRVLDLREADRNAVVAGRALLDARATIIVLPRNCVVRAAGGAFDQPRKQVSAPALASGVFGRAAFAAASEFAPDVVPEVILDDAKIGDRDSDPLVFGAQAVEPLAAVRIRILPPFAAVPDEFAPIEWIVEHADQFFRIAADARRVPRAAAWAGNLSQV
ncbi:hypothetical protein QYC26_10500 [Sphingomonas sp. C3-2]|nr:hypothetical protein [Sphingomonas sp. C3-2]WOK35447.1 hypothetical protein QYC26_10500 [Sphingomonas sp. C3-2]